MDQKRYFIGLSLPPELTAKISEVQETLYNPQIMLQPLIPHITLLHPNVLMTLSPLYFLPKVREATSSLLPINVKLTGIGSFGNRVLHVKVESEGLAVIHTKLVSLLPEKIRAQYYVGRDFVPHVTVAQGKMRHTIDADTKARFGIALKKLLPCTFTSSYITYFSQDARRSYRAQKL